jgi:hypothetical protein
MKGKGPKYERETIINFNEESDTASIWTASEVVYRRLMKLGYMPFQDNERSAVFEMPKRDVKLPRPKRVISEARRERIRESLKTKRNGIVCPFCLVLEVVWTMPNRNKGNALTLPLNRAL